MNVDIQLTPNFNLKEFLHNGSDEGLSPEIVENLRRLAQALEKVRTLLGNRPITIDSGFRTWAHHLEIYKQILGQKFSIKQVPKNSQHLFGKAADIVVQGVAPKVVQEILKDWDGGLGSYTVFTHVDIGPKRRWSGP
jgi:uncharacterized protein YcbK (DUF882 family)